jgi:hypothetical protein
VIESVTCCEEEEWKCWGVECASSAVVGRCSCVDNDTVSGVTFEVFMVSGAIVCSGSVLIYVDF